MSTRNRDIEIETAEDGIEVYIKLDDYSGDFNVNLIRHVSHSLIFDLDVEKSERYLFSLLTDHLDDNELILLMKDFIKSVVTAWQNNLGVVTGDFLVSVPFNLVVTSRSFYQRFDGVTVAEYTLKISTK